MVQELWFIEFEECGWVSMLDRLEGTDYFEFLTKIQNENSRDFEYQMCSHLSQISKEYLHALLY
jgi:hypothetical protein